MHVSGQIIATSNDLTPIGGLVREIPLFQWKSRLVKYYDLARCIWMFPTIVAPPNHPFQKGFSMIFTIHFGVALFLETSIYWVLYTGVYIYHHWSWRCKAQPPKNAQAADPLPRSISQTNIHRTWPIFAHLYRYSMYLLIVKVCLASPQKLLCLSMFLFLMER